MLHLSFLDRYFDYVFNFISHVEGSFQASKDLNTLFQLRIEKKKTLHDFL